MKFSIIIPTLNEEYFLKKNIEALNSFKEEFEIIIADGGSIDRTLDVAEEKNVKVIKSPMGRGTQLNAGAKEANGEFLIFLHADTFLPDNAFNLIEEFFADSAHKICRFLLDFDHKLLDIYSRFSKYDTQLTRFGDSAIIIRKTFFDELGGFENRETFEDVEFLKQASRFGRINILNALVTSSSRRFVQNGIIKKQLVNLFIFIGYLLNVSSPTLSKMFNKKLKTRTDSIIIFVRYPRKGQVKTRLAKTTSSEFALNFYKLCAENLIRNIKKVPSVNRFVFYSNKNEKTETINWLRSNFLFAPQEGNDLGSRMKNAFEKVFSAGSQKVIIIGTDIPDLSKEVIVKAFEMLDTYDVVIGPDKDGGYYLLGMKKMNAELFEKIEYSTSSVLSETLFKIKELNLAYSLLPELKDIDTEDDLLNWLSHDHNNPIKKDVKLAYKPA